MENILSLGLSVTQFTAFIGFILMLGCTLFGIIYSVRAGRQAKYEDEERKRKDDEYAEFKKLVFQRLDEQFDAFTELGKDFIRHDEKIISQRHECEKNHGR